MCYQDIWYELNSVAIDYGPRRNVSIVHLRTDMPCLKGVVQAFKPQGRWAGPDQLSTSMSDTHRRELHQLNTAIQAAQKGLFSSSNSASKAQLTTTSSKIEDYREVTIAIIVFYVSQLMLIFSGFF